MTFPKLTADKPIPISPLIALDRERCILCYRCTRFSEEVAEDGQLVAVNRGAATEIATFEDDPYRSVFSGNVVELCPVGALTSTLYRFEARPWEIANVPTVCTGCGVGCNVSATIREGKVKRILSRNHPEVDRGWLCDKGRFTYPHLQARDRITTPLRRGPKGLAEVSWDDALDAAEELLREAGAATVTALSGSETNEIAYALGRLLRGGIQAHTAVLPEATSDSLEAFRLPLSAIAEAELVVVVGDDPVIERAPIVELWIKEARRRGGEVVVCSPTGDVKTAPGGAATACADIASAGSALGSRLRASERAVLVWSGPGGGGGARVAELAHELGFEGRPGCGAYHLPTTPNGRGVAAAWSVAADADEIAVEDIGLLVVSGEEAAASDSVRALAEKAGSTIVITMFHDVAAGWADLILPATGALERDGTTMNLEGRLQRLRRTVLPPCPDELAWIGKLAARFGVEVGRRPRLSTRSSRGTCSPTSPWTRSGSRRRSPRGSTTRRRSPRHPRQPPRPRRTTRFGSTGTGRCSPDRRSSEFLSSRSCGPTARSSSPRPTPTGAESRRATASSSARTEPPSSCARGSTAP